MQLNFTGRNIDVSPALKTFTKEKLERLQHRHENIQSIHLFFHVENVNHIAEATAHCDGAEIHAKAESEDMYSAVDKLVEKLTAQIMKHKDKQTDHR
jgi:putative sigma-54 modulation protein